MVVGQDATHIGTPPAVIGGVKTGIVAGHVQNLRFPMILVDILAGQSGEDVHVSNTIALVHVVRYGGIRPGGGMSGVGVVGDMFKAVIRISSNLILYCIPFVI
jgi:hypothetical protein